MNCTTHEYPKKIKDKVAFARNCGVFLPQQVSASDIRCTIGTAGSLKEGCIVSFYALVDTQDGCVIDVRFQAFGPSFLIAAAEVCCTLAAGKNYDQIRRIHTDLIDKQLRSHPEESVYTVEMQGVLHLVLEALQQIAKQCIDIALPDTYVSPVPHTHETQEPQYPDWEVLSEKKRLAIIEEVLDTDIRPYIELDAGGIAVERLTSTHEVVIAYQGACTSCYSSIGATLSTIQHILQTKVYSGLTVTPNMDHLHLE